MPGHGVVAVLEVRDEPRDRTPRFQGQASSTAQARERARASRPEMAAAHLKAVEDVAAKYRAEVGQG